MLLSNLTQNPDITVINNTTTTPPPTTATLTTETESIKQETVELCNKFNVNNNLYQQQQEKQNHINTSADILVENSLKNCLNLVTKKAKIITKNNSNKIYKTSSCIGIATDFSIAAIMARGGNASSREPSERSLSE